MTKYRYLLLPLAALLLTSCAMFNPLGMSDAEFGALTPAQQFEARKRQAELDTQREIARQAAEQARQERLSIQIQAERQKLHSAHSREPVVQVGISGGCVQMYGECKSYYLQPFDLVLGEYKRVSFFDDKRRSIGSVWVAYQRSGIYIDTQIPTDLEGLDNFLLIDDALPKNQYYQPYLIAQSPFWGNHNAPIYQYNFQTRHIKAKDIQVVVRRFRGF